MAEVALLGTGRMGHELAIHLMKAGHHLTVWNRTPAGADTTVAAGATRALTAADAARAGKDMVITCLFGPDAVQEVVVDGQALPPGTLWLDVTTVGPEDADHYAAWAQQHNVRYVYGPVVGSIGPARAGKLGVYLGGIPADVAAVRPFAALWADPSRLVEVSTPRAAAIAKLVANLALGVALEGLAEALQFGAELRADAASVLAMLKGTALGWIADFKGPMILDGSYDQTQFSVDLLAKDVRLMLAAMPPQSETSLLAVKALLNNLERVQQQGRGNQDIAALAAVMK